MGRELKMVSLDFKWPLNQVWKGCLNPYHGQDCKSCDGSGQNKATKQISDDWYDFKCTGRKWSNNITELEVEALVKGGRLSDLMDKWYSFDDEKNIWTCLDRPLPHEERKWIECEKPVFPTPEDVNKWNEKGFGHDSCNQWICVEARAKSLGVYGSCEYCGGAGEIWQSNDIKELHEKWEPIEPTIGKGFQLWETTSEGSPCTPVFFSLDELCEYCESNVSTFADNYVSKEKWKEMLDEDFVRHVEGGNIFI